ncbi:MAG TPA: hypothetical protein DCQ14_01770 [Firmicutes bacterium]|nr:hypothetical protein [Bacillota bacterium]
MKQDILAYFRDNPGIFIFMTLVIIAGVACGALLVRFLDEGPLQEITVTLNRFFADLKEEENNFLTAPELLRVSYYRNGALLLLIWALGFFSAGFSLSEPEKRSLYHPVLFFHGSRCIYGVNWRTDGGIYYSGVYAFRPANSLIVKNIIPKRRGFFSPVWNNFIDIALF